MKKILYKNYTINPANNRLEFPKEDFPTPGFGPEDLLFGLEVDSQEFWYLPSETGLGATFGSDADNHWVTLQKDISGAAGTENLQIWLILHDETEYYSNLSEYEKLYPIGAEEGKIEFDVCLHQVLQSFHDESTYIDEIPSGYKFVQVFKATNEDIHGFYGVFKGKLTDTGTVLDDFDTYTSQADLEAVWDAYGGKINMTFRDGTGYETNGVSFAIDAGGDGQYIERPWTTPEDFTGYDAITYWHKSTSIREASFFAIQFVDNSSNTATKIIPAALYLYWHKHTDLLDSFTLDMGTFDWSNVSAMRFISYDYDGYSQEYIDEIYGIPIVQPPRLETGLVYFGETKPVVDDALPGYLTLDNGGTKISSDVPYTNAVVRANISYGHAHYTTNEMTVGHYYGIVTRCPEADTSLAFYGKDGIASGDEGYFKTSGGVLTEEIGKTLRHMIVGHVSGVIEHITIKFNGDPGAGSLLWLEYVDVGTHAVIRTPVMRNLQGDERVIPFDFKDKPIYVDRTVGLYGFFQSTTATKATQMEVDTIGYHNGS
ncbi:MAG: hypothetical protein GWN00_01315 [Aliifodinibius sp.]|nr:hypothetical protein [Fodinibius sp.]NIV09971.1 hypothetical protein [Fodinibius sp.]NIY23501.1 hypothetical protein [Fodinibius sp.]